MNRLVLLVAFGAITARSAQAQEPQMGPMPGMEESMTQLMEVLETQPSVPMLLQLRRPLGLTDEQVQRLETIQQQMQQAHDTHFHAAMQSLQRARSILELERPDFGEYEEELSEGADHFVGAHTAMARASVDARGVLTPEQWTGLQTATAVMREMMQRRMGGMGGQGTPDGPQQHQHPPR